MRPRSLRLVQERNLRGEERDLLGRAQTNLRDGPRHRQVAPESPRVGPRLVEEDLEPLFLERGIQFFGQCFEAGHIIALEINLEQLAFEFLCLLWQRHRGCHWCQSQYRRRIPFRGEASLSCFPAVASP